MWLLQGRFAEESRQELSKLLKYGQTYTLGRKIPADIVIDSKFVSRVSCHISIGSEDSIASQVANVSDPLAFHNNVALRPRVTIRFEANKSRKTFGVTQQPDPSRRNPSSEPTEVQVPADQEHELQDGDCFALTTTISLRLVWKPVAVCFAAKVKESTISPLRKPALQLGIYLSPAKSRWRDGYTHLCLAQVKPTESVLCALLQARPIVTIDYFQQLFRRADLPRHDAASLETSLDELDLVTYQPPFDQQELSDVPDLQQKLLPQQRRTYMFKGTTCVLFALPHEESELSIYKSILSVAGAHVFTHNPQAEGLQTKADFAKLLMPYKNSALSYWRNSGSKARSEAPDEGLVVLVGAVHDHTAWKDACAIACTNLRIAMPTGFHAITNAIFAGDVRAHLNAIPNMLDGHQEEEIVSDVAADVPAQAVGIEAAADVTAIEPVANASPPPAAAAAQNEATRVNRTERTAAEPSAVTPEPSNTSGEVPRRPLTRRTRKPAHDAERVDVEAVHENVPGEENSNDGRVTASKGADLPDPPVSASQLTRAERTGLTRRTGASRANARRSDVFDALLQSNGSIAADDGSASMGGVDAAVSSAVPRSRRYRMDLDEEDRAQTQASEASQAVNPGHTTDNSGNKRKSPPRRQASDATIPTGENATQSPASKRPRTAAIEAGHADQPDTDPSPHPNLPRIIHTDPTPHNSGLTNGAQPDSEPQFLQALNTQRAKGKKMDDFDVEFNRLQIAKPGTQSLDKFIGSRGGRSAQQPTQTNAGGAIDEDYEAFKQMAEEELRIHVRGNFVQVDFVPLVRQKKASGEQVPRSGVGVPNFKKFRPKAVAGSTRGTISPVASDVSRPQIALVLPESNDYGLGQSYWEDQQSGTVAGSLPAARRERSSRTARQATMSDEESETIRSSRSKPRSGGRVAMDPASVEEAAVDLGLDGLDSMESEDEADMTRMLERRHGGRSQRAASSRGTKRPAAMVQQDADDDMVSTGVSASRKKRASARGVAMLVDDNEDDIDDDEEEEDDDDDDDHDDGNFAGFGRSTSTRRRRDPPASGTGRSRRSIF